MTLSFDPYPRQAASVAVPRPTTLEARSRAGPGRDLRPRTQDGGAVRGGGCRHAVRSRQAAVAAIGVAAFVVLCVADGADRPPGWALALIALAAAIPIVLGLVLAWRRPV